MSIDAPNRLHLCKGGFHYSNAYKQHDAGPDVKDILAGFGRIVGKKHRKKGRLPTVASARNLSQRQSMADF
jgi:hypothetical protein